ncbi:MAG: CHAT domain-containing protein, partial [Pseudonocardiaceae bacterium]
MTMLDLELEIGRSTGGSYPVVARVGGQVATSRLPVTSTPLAHPLGAVSSAVRASAAAPRPAATEDEPPVRDWGGQLFEALITGDVRDLYLAGRKRSHEQGAAMRLVLRVRPAELARLPWEFLADPDEQDYLGVGLTLLRHPEVLASRQPLQVAAPLRILGMVVRSDDQQDGGEARQRLGAALAGWERAGVVQLGWVAGQTAAALQDALNEGPWHAFHLAGPGIDDFSPLLIDHHTLRLVLFNVCGREDTSSDQVVAAATALTRQGMPAVVAMQFEISDLAESRFAQALYHSVATGLPVDIGVLRGRRAVRLAKKDTLEWGTPVLYLRAPEAPLFQGPAAPADQPSTPEPESRYAQALDAFWTGQWDQAAELLRKVLADRPDHPDAAAKLEQACQERDLAARYAEACAAADAEDWEEAIAGFAAVADADPTKVEVHDRLADARRQQEAAALRAQARQEVSDPIPSSPLLVPHPKTRRILHIRKEVNAVTFSPNGGLLATAGSKNVAQIWDTTGREVLSVGSKAWRRTMEGVVFSPDGWWLATASDDSTARIWDATSGDELLKVTHDAQVWGVAFSPDGRRLATASDDCTARIWDATSGDELLKVTHDNWVRDLAFSPDGRWLATAGVDRTARIWDTADGEELVTVTHDGLVVGVAFSPDGRWLATASDDHTAGVWDIVSGAQLATLAHDKPVRGVAFSPDGRWLATAGDDHTARTWAVSSGQQLATLTHDKPVRGVAFSP